MASSRCFTALVVVVALASGCRCGPPVTTIPTGSFDAIPSALQFNPTWVGAQRQLELTIRNSGAAIDAQAITITGPFMSSATELVLARGDSVVLTITFTPMSAGGLDGRLEVGSLSVPLSGEGIAPLQCVAPSACVGSNFDFVLGQCLEANLAAGTACTTSCVQGACDGAMCVGALIGCNDDDACTIDGCSEITGCSHVPRQCPPPASPCEVPRCDRLTGCAVERSDDGTLCGVDDCLATSVSVCVSGQCVARTRPPTGRCSNRWKPLDVPARFRGGQAWDPIQNETLLFGGGAGGTQLRGDTWRWNGARWEQLFPADSPAPRSSFGMTTDTTRQRIVLFGGSTFSDTWEWNGVTWLQRQPATSPPARAHVAMAFDARRGRVVLFSDETWEWDGSTWTRVLTAHSPPATSGHALGWDARRERVVFVDQSTWEYDGADWVQASNAAPVAQSRALVWDDVLERLLLITGSETWSWNGSTWTQLAPQLPLRRFASVSWDARRRRVVRFGGLDNTASFDTWERDSTAWSERTPRVGPQAVEVSVAADGARGVVALGEFPAPAGDPMDVWHWDGNTWFPRRAPGTPSVRSAAALGYDAARDRLVLFGGIDSSGRLDDTWEWDGTSWTELNPTHRPPAWSSAMMAFDPLRGRIVMFGSATSSTRDQTWEWDGVDWQQRSSASLPPDGGALVRDERDQRTLLFTSGSIWQWDGSGWSLAVVNGSGPQGNVSAAFDRQRQLVLLFGDQQTWEWANNAWTQRQPHESPSSGSLVWDPIRQRVMALENGTMWVFLP